MADVLDSASIHGQDGATKANLMQKAILATLPPPEFLSRLNTFLENMTSSGLINTLIYQGGHTYVLTSKGIQFLSEYRKFVDMADSFGLEM